MTPPAVASAPAASMKQDCSLVTASASLQLVGTAPLSGSGVLNVSTVQLESATAPLSGSATLSATARLSLGFAPQTLNPAASLAAINTVQFDVAAAALAPAGTLTGTASIRLAGTAALIGSGALTASPIQFLAARLHKHTLHLMSLTKLAPLPGRKETLERQRNIEKEPDTAILPCLDQPSNTNFHHFRPAANRADIGDREKAYWRRSA
jgi:hypothetical protein